MQIEFSLKENHKDRWVILVEGVKWREVHPTIFGKKPALSSPASEENLKSAFDEYEYQRVKGYVLWRLSSQSYHSEQLAKLLKDRLVQTKTIQCVLQEYQEKGFLNDEAWLQGFMQINQKRYGLSVILSKLRLKGLSSDTLEQLSSDWKNPEEEIQAIQHLLQTRYRSKDIKDYRIKQKVIAALARKGYGFDQIKLAFQGLNQDSSLESF